MSSSAFDAIIGHAWARRLLQTALGSGRLAQSHLIVGPPQVGKTAMARALAAEALAARAGNADRARTLALGGRHPDLAWVAPDDGGSIKVETIRNLLHALALAPVEGGARVAVIDQADAMTDGARNALLKTLEEPNPSVVIILTAPNVDSLIPTIVSRCQTLSLRAVATDDIDAALRARGLAPERASQLARAARGCPGWALSAVNSESLVAARAQRRRDLIGLLSASRTDRLLFSEKLGRAGEDEEREAMLQTWQGLWRDLARAAAPGGAADPEISALAQRIGPRTAFAAARDTREAMKRLRENARPQLVFDALLLRYPRLAAG